MSGQIKRKRRLRSDGKRSNSIFVLLEKKAPKISIENMGQAEIDNRIYKKVGVLTIEDEMKYIEFETQLSPAWKNKQYFILVYNQLGLWIITWHLLVKTRFNQSASSPRGLICCQAIQATASTNSNKK
jgi:hypothetical protein